MYDQDACEGYDSFDEAAYFNECEDVELVFDDEDEDDYEYDGQPDEYTEWQDFMGGDDWDHGQYDSDV